MFSTTKSLGSAVLVVGLTAGVSGLARAQMTTGPGLSSGSGAGTGAGGFAGVQRNRSGSVSGVGPGASEGAVLRGRPLTQPPGYRREVFGPSLDVTFPNDPYLVPFLTMEQPGATSDPTAPTHVTNELLKNARLIATPDERSLALQRIANGAIASAQLTLAHKTLEEAMAAAAEVKVPLVRDQRLIAIVTSLTNLSDALLRDRRENMSGAVAPEADAARPDAVPPDGSKPEALPKALDGTTLIRMARLEWQRGVYLASVISNPTYRNEMLYKVAESEASGSASIANESMKASEVDSLADRPAPAAPSEKDKPLALDDRARARQAKNDTLRQLADSILVSSFEDAKKIDRLIWKYRAMVRIALAAADSQQYSRGVELAHGIDNGESRAEAMLILAESQCRNTQTQIEAATATYQAAAEAMATVQQDGLRGVLAGFLIDSLISTGRFDDARACVVLFPELSQRLVALGAVAEAQGRRGAAESARRWIANDVPEQYRPTLYRRVVTGVLWAIDQNRSKEFLRPDSTTPIP
jgi:hypothetical protein